MGRTTTDYAISELEYLALPPVLRRKFFSSLERLRLEQDGRAPCSTASGRRRHWMVGARAASVLSEVFTLSSAFRPGLNKRGLTAANQLRKHDTIAWFASLPPAVQRKQFSLEEQVIFASGGHCIVVDSADKTAGRRPRCHNRGPFPPRSACLDGRTPERRVQDDHFYFCFDGSDAGSDRYHCSGDEHGAWSGSNCSNWSNSSSRSNSYRSNSYRSNSYSSSRSNSCSNSCGNSITWYGGDLDEVDDLETVAWSIDSMADYSIDSFCFLEDEAELDLRLDDYHQAMQETAASSQACSLARHRTARNMSLSSTSLRKSSLSSQTMALSTRSQTSSLQLKRSPSPTPVLCSSASAGLLHRPRPSTASIDPQAMFYQDPAARMQLRLYLASPSKFDEAVEFGFPALLDATPEASVASPTLSEATDTAQSADEGVATFLSDDTPSLLHEDDGQDHDGELTDEHDKWNDPHTPQEVEFKRESPKRGRPPMPSRERVPAQSYAQWRSGAGREMTMHMTLTRPDLRSPEEMERLGINSRPMERAALPACDVGASIWEPQAHEQSRMRKMWNRLRSR